MDKIRFLFDECVPDTLLEALLRKEPSIDVVCVGVDDGPRKGTFDSELLEVADSGVRVFVSRDKKTMPGHLADRFRQGKHTAGVILLKSNWTMARVLDDLLMIWIITSPDEWKDRTEILPY